MLIDQISERNHISEQYWYEAIRLVVPEKLAALPDEMLSTLIDRYLNHLPTELAEGITESLGNLAGSLLPMAGNLVGTAVAGQTGGAIGNSLGTLLGQLGGVNTRTVTSQSSQLPAATRRPTIAATQSSIGTSNASLQSPANQLLILINNPQFLISILREIFRNPNPVRIRNRQNESTFASFESFANAISVLGERLEGEIQPSAPLQDNTNLSISPQLSIEQILSKYHILAYPGENLPVLKPGDLLLQKAIGSPGWILQNELVNGRAIHISDHSGASSGKVYMEVANERNRSVQPVATPKGRVLKHHFLFRKTWPDSPAPESSTPFLPAVPGLSENDTRLNTPIILVPGIMGTRLELSSGRLVWNPTGSGVRSFIARQLRRVFSSVPDSRGAGPFAADDGQLGRLIRRGMNIDLQAVRPATDAARVRTHLSTAAGGNVNLARKMAARQVRNFEELVPDFYDQMAAELAEPISYQFPNGRVTFTPTVYCCGYDWRHDLWRNADRLQRVVERALRETGTQQVIIVAHSMGGLLARAYCQKHRATTKVRSMYLLGTPNFGAPKAYRLLKTGLLVNGIPVDISADKSYAILFPNAVVPRFEQDFVKLIRKFPGIYELMPSTGFPNDWLSPMVRVRSSKPFPDQLYLDRGTGAGLRDALYRSSSPVERQWTDRCLDFRESFYSNLGCYFHPQTNLIYSSSYPGGTERVLNFIVTQGDVSIARKGPGDGTVPIESATFQRSANASRPCGRSAGAPSPRNMGNVEHGALPNNARIIREVRNRIKNELRIVATGSTPIFGGSGSGGVVT